MTDATSSALTVDQETRNTGRSGSRMFFGWMALVMLMLNLVGFAPS